LLSNDITIGDIYTYATALEEKDTDGPGQILAFVHPKPSRSNNTAGSAIHISPEYNGSVEHVFDGDNPLLMNRGWDESHNYYKWNLFDAQEANILRISEGIPIVLSGFLPISGVTAIEGNIEIGDIRIRSNEVYQQGEIIGELGKIWGMQVDRVKTRIINGSGYDNDSDVNDETTPELGGSGMPLGWEPIGFDLVNGQLTGTGSFYTDDLVIEDAVITLSGYISGNLVDDENTDSEYNSINVRIPVPKDYIIWNESGFYFWNKSDNGASIRIKLLDTNNVIIVDTGEVVNSGWTESIAHVSGEFEPNDWFTVQAIMKSTGNNSSFIGEMSLYYHNYSI
jgi:hypothetical protein